jgi:hypothetical protein
LPEVPRCAPTGKSLKRGIGLFNYLDTMHAPSSSIACWFVLAPDHYNETWAQVSRGAFTDCTILLELAPVQMKSLRPLWDVVKDRSLFVLGASIRFVRRKR